MYLLVYTGTCASATIGGVKFTQKRRTANILDSKKHLFLTPQGKPIYDNIDVIKLEKKDLVNEEKIVKEVVERNQKAEVVEDEAIEETVDSLKRKYNLEELRAMCEEKDLSSDGSKTELAKRILGEE